MDETVLKIKLEDQGPPDNKSGSGGSTGKADSSLFDKFLDVVGDFTFKTKEASKAIESLGKQHKTSPSSVAVSRKSITDWAKSQPQKTDPLSVPLSQRLQAYKASKAMQRAGAPPVQSPTAKAAIQRVRARRPNTWSRRAKAGLIRRIGRGGRAMLGRMSASGGAAIGASVGTSVTLGTGSATLGSAAGAAAGAAIPALASNPIGLAILGAASAAKVLTESFSAMNQRVRDNVNRLSEYSGAINKAKGLAERDTILQDLRHARQSGSSAGKYVEVSEGFDRDLKEMAEPLKRLGTQIMTGTYSLGRMFTKPLAELAKGLNEITSDGFWSKVWADSSKKEFFKALSDHLQGIEKNTRNQKSPEQLMIEMVDPLINGFQEMLEQGIAEQFTPRLARRGSAT